MLEALMDRNACLIDIQRGGPQNIRKWPEILDMNL